MSVYTVYRTTNKLNGMFYIGVHKTADPNDDYLGSGKRLRCAIKKYGVENFQKEVLFVFEIKEEAYAKEKELVTQDVLDYGACYNLKLGGEGGWDFANSKGLNTSGNRNYLNGFTKPGSNVNEIKSKMSNSHKLTYVNATRRICPPDWTGKFHSEETKQKISKSAIGKQKGSKNSQFGSKWITDGILNKKIKKDQEIPEGWRSGRVK